jgi:glycosyltransferase involved in cell wall biosynthesis
MRVLILAPRYPSPAWRGDQVRVLQLAKALSRSVDVRLLAFGPSDAPPIEGIEARSIAFSPAGRLSANLRSPSPRLPGQVRLFLDRAMERAVADEISGWRPEVVHATLARTAPYLPPPGSAHRHLDLVDSLYLNMRERARSSGIAGRAAFGFEARLMRDYERTQAARADSASAVSEADRLAAGLPERSVIPNGVDLDAFGYEEPGARAPEILFFGNLGYFHNQEPARFLAAEVLPRVREQVPGATLRVAGARPSASLRQALARAGAELVDSPPDMPAQLRRAAVAALPMFSGSGIKNKVLEAFSIGLPVVSNRLGIDGVAGAVPGEHYLLAEGGEGIADAAATLLQDEAERRRLAAAGRALVERSYTWERQARALLEVYGSGGAR